MSRASACKVCIRTRPTASFAQQNIRVHDDKQKISVSMPKAENPNAQDSWTWRFDAVLHNASQATVYEEQVAPVVESVLQGFNGTVMCYGQTGAGKTFTQLGSVDNYNNRGIVPRALTDIFAYVHDHPQLDATISLSYLEIHNDTLVDLLGTLPTETPQSDGLHLFEDKAGATHVKGLRLEKVTSEEEALNMLFEGQNNRAIANHQLNRNSTRGHSIFTIYMQIRSRVESSGVVKVCKLHMIDLAGSERLKKTDTMGELRNESMYINRSLSYLEQVVVALSNKGRAHTPYRQSKLTHLLKDSLGGNCKTLLIANVYGEEQHLDETVSTLHFASRVRLVPNEASVNTQQDPEQLLKKYAAQIHDLKRELAMHDSLSARSGITYEPYSEQQRLALMQRLQSFLEHQTDDIELESVRQMRELLYAARTLFEKKDVELQDTRRSLASGGGSRVGEGGDSIAAAAAGGGLEGEDQGAVGANEAGRGIAIGKAPDGAKPQGGVLDPPGAAVDGAAEGGAEGGAASGGGPTATEGSAPPDRQEAFVQFKASEGSLTNQRLLQAKRDLKATRAERQALTKAVNAAKSSIDQVKARLDAKRHEREAMAQTSEEEADIIDEEEYSFIQMSKTSKLAYKENHEALVKCSSLLEEHTNAVESIRQELLKDFDEWYTMSFSSFADEPSVPVAAARSPANDTMDDDEQFDQLQMARVLAEEPESLAFVRARKSVKIRNPRR